MIWAGSGGWGKHQRRGDIYRLDRFWITPHPLDGFWPFVVRAGLYCRRWTDQLLNTELPAKERWGSSGFFGTTRTSLRRQKGGKDTKAD